MTSSRVAFVLIFAMVQLCTADYVVYGRKMTLDDNLSLNPNQCHHPLITQLTWCDLGEGFEFKLVVDRAQMANLALDFNTFLTHSNVYKTCLESET